MTFEQLLKLADDPSIIEIRVNGKIGPSGYWSCVIGRSEAVDRTTYTEEDGFVTTITKGDIE